MDGSLGIIAACGDAGTQAGLAPITASTAAGLRPFSLAAGNRSPATGSAVGARQPGPLPPGPCVRAGVSGRLNDRNLTGQLGDVMASRAASPPAPGRPCLASNSATEICRLPGSRVWSRYGLLPLDRLAAFRSAG